MRLNTLLLAAALAAAIPTQAVVAQTSSSTKKESAAVDYNKLYKSAVADYNANRNLEARAKFQKILRKYPKHPQTQRYVVMINNRLRAAAKVPMSKRRLHALTLEEASFEEATLAEVMEYVVKQAKELSKGKVKPGLVIRGGDPVRDRQLTFKVGKVALDDLIDTVANLTNTTVKYTDHAITFTPLPTAKELEERRAKQLEIEEAKERARAEREAAARDPFRRR